MTGYENGGWRSCEGSSPPGPTQAITAQYDILGSREQFLADLNILQSNTTSPPTATISGVVASGWHIGASVSGTYSALSACLIPTPGNIYGTLCFAGSLTITP